MKSVAFFVCVLVIPLGVTICTSTMTTEVPLVNSTQSLYRRFNFIRRRTKFPILPPKLRQLATTTTVPAVSSTDQIQKRFGLLDWHSSENMSVLIKPIPISSLGKIENQSSSAGNDFKFTDMLGLSPSPSNPTTVWRLPKNSSLNSNVKIKRPGFSSIFKLSKDSADSNMLLSWPRKNTPPWTSAVTSTPVTTATPTTTESLRENAISLQSLSVVWPVPRKSVSRRMWTTNVISTPTSSTPLPKLLLPKPTRPAIYSLDGFIPKPSMIHLTTTPAPDYNLLASASRRSDIKLPETIRYQRKSSRRFSIIMRRKGVPGRDFPIYTHIPATSFQCGPDSGMYADPKTGCQIWHMCPGGGKPHRYSFLCPHGTVFSQVRGICDWWYKVDCESESLRN